MLVIAGRMSARYSGRIEEAELSLGDAVLMIRDYESGGDGSVVLLDAAEGLQPRNWMPARSTHEKTEAGYKFTCRRADLTETLEVFIEKIYDDMSFTANLVTHLQKLGAEQELSELLAGNLHVLEPGLKLVGREVRTAAGPIDIMAEDKSGRLTIIEVKRRRATLTDVYQWRRYRDSVHADAEWGRKHPRGLLVAPSATRDLLSQISDEKRLRFVRLSYEQVCEQTKRRK